MKAYIITVVEIPGEQTEEFIQEKKFAFLHRLMYAIGDAAWAFINIIPSGEQTSWIKGNRDELESDSDATFRQTVEEYFDRQRTT